MLTARNLTVRLGRRTVLDHLDFSAGPGLVTAIIGPNGSGKTTLLRALSGEVPRRGEVFINGRPLDLLPPWQLATQRAVLAQATSLAFPFSVREVLSLGLVAAAIAGGARQRDLVEAALARVDLRGFAGRLYADLSGGEQQRVQLARVLLQVWSPVRDGRPCWLLLDEPVSSLDIRHQLLVMDLARGFAAAGGGVVAVLHDLNLAALFADRLALMRDGAIAASGPPPAVLTDDNIAAVFGCVLRVGVAPRPGTPFVLPDRLPPTAGLSP